MPYPYPNLPHVGLVMVDGNLTLPNTQSLTASLLIIGPALDGPTEEPQPLTNLTAAEAMFGPVVFNTQYTGPNGETAGYAGNALVKALREALGSGASDVRLLRVGGTKATATYTVSSAQSSPSTSGTISFTARFGGRIYNQATVTFAAAATSGTCTIGQPACKGGNVVISYTGPTSGLTVAQLVDRINGHPSNRTVRAALGTVTSTVLARNLNSTCTLSGGTDGTVKDDLATNKTSYYTALTTANTGVFALLDEYNVDVCHLTGIYLDDLVVAADATKSVAVDFANWLGKRSIDYPIFGVIGLKPLDDFSTKAKIATHFGYLTSTVSGFRDTGSLWTTAGYFMNNGFVYTDTSLEQPLDAGGLLQVVAAEAEFQDRDLLLYRDTAAAAYAGRLTTLAPGDAATFKGLPGIRGIPYQFNRTQRNILAGGVGTDNTAGAVGGGAYVLLERTDDRGIVITSDVTASFRNSDFSTYQIVSIASIAERGVRRIGRDFLGKENSPAIRLGLQSQLKTFLDSMAAAGALLGPDGIGYNLNIWSDDATSQILGQIVIDLVLRPAFQIKSITLRVSVSR